MDQRAVIRGPSACALIASESHRIARRRRVRRPAHRLRQPVLGGATAGDRQHRGLRVQAEHTATAARRFDTGVIEHGEGHTVTLRKRGTVRYICDLHPFMKAVIVAR